VRSASLADLQGALGDGTVLVEFHRYAPVDFNRGQSAEAHWAAVVLAGFAPPVVLDLGAVSATEPLIATLLKGGPEAGAAARTLYDQLIAPLGPALTDVQTVVLAPDGGLHLVPFASLRQADGRLWAQAQALRVVQTGRDLLRPPADRPARSLLALGGIDFDKAPARLAAVEEKAEGAEIPDPLLGNQPEQLRSLTSEIFRQGFAALPGSAEEVEQIARQYRVMRKDEPVETWTADQATEDRLKANARPPRVLHLATHGFYRAPAERADQPMLLAGVALAGANRALRGAGEDGILYAVEAQGLNLEGTELVVLSACETAQGPIAYGEGVYGLVRALRTAGAAHVLATLRPVGDEAARDFMGHFYRHWLAQARSDPAAALRQTQQDYIDGRASGDWTSFILIGGVVS
jgi:CHAT domain-containing protein